MDYVLLSFAAIQRRLLQQQLFLHSPRTHRDKTHANLGRTILPYRRRSLLDLNPHSIQGVCYFNQMPCLTLLSLIIDLLQNKTEIILFINHF